MSFVVMKFGGTSVANVERIRNVARHVKREVDAGEQVTAGLLAIVLQSMGIQARSWQGWQIPIITDSAHGVARIKSIPGEKIRARLEQGEVAVITGIQGIE